MATRSKKVVINTSCEILFVVTSAVCSFVLPRLILARFGSTYNGITSSITEFIGCVALLKSGIGSVTRAALYRPLAIADSNMISEVVNATAGFMKKIALVFSILVVAFAAVYPFIVSEDFEWFFSFTLVFILSISTFAQYFFGLTYQMVLEADQRNYIISICNILSIIVNTVIASVLILCGFGIHAVKMGSAMVFIIPPLFYNIYVKKRYKINSAVPANYDLIKQRWDAFGHQLASFVNTNTDIVIATIFLGIREVSVYSVYYLVGNGIKKAIIAMGTGTTAAFGNMIAKNEQSNLKKRFEQYEVLVYCIATTLLCITGILFVPFVKLYTKGVDDVDYCRPIFGVLICASIFFEAVKTPYQQIVFAAGEFKHTKKGAYAEAIINIIVSLVLVNIMGLNGIVIGTIVAILYRVIRFNNFMCKHIIVRRWYDIYLMLGYSTICAILSWILSLLLPLYSIDNYFTWIMWAVIVSLIVAVFTIGIGYIVFKKKLIANVVLLKSVFTRKTKER